MFATTASSLLALAVLARFSLPILMSRWTWAVFTIGISLIMVGGFMFVRIRGMPYVGAGQNGVDLIAQGFQTQYGIEVQVIAFLCTSCLPVFKVHTYPLDLRSRWFIISQLHLLDPHPTSLRLSCTSTLRCLCLDWVSHCTLFRPCINFQDQEWR